VIHKPVKLLIAEDHRGYHLTFVYVLALVCDDAHFCKLRHAAGYKLSVDTKIVFLLEAFRHGIRYAAYAELDAGTVRDVARNYPANVFVLFCEGDIGNGGDGVVRLHKIIHIAVMHDEIAVGEGEVRIYLKDCDVRSLHHASFVSV